MADALKEMFNKPFYNKLAIELQKANKHFHPDKFVKEVTSNIEHLSLNQRLRNTSVVLKQHLPADYKKSIGILTKTIPHIDRGYTTLVFPDFVGMYGHDNFEISMEALSYFTQFGSSEFAIREYLKRDFVKTIKVMDKWAVDKNHHVRRLASEGSRPRLPWSFKLDAVIKNPDLTLPILEKLKTDSELYVRKSVANHLNDISKDNTDWMLKVLTSWDKANAHTLWIVKHASRTLIKKGNKQSLSLFDFEKNVKAEVLHLKLDKARLRLGDTLQFEFDMRSQKPQTQKLVIDYAIHYYKKTGVLSPKVFKLKEIQLPGNGMVHLVKKHRFQDFTTRKHYPGKHAVEIIVNGIIAGRKEFELLE